MPTPADYEAEAAELLPWIPQDDDGLRYRQQQLATGLVAAYEEGRTEAADPIPAALVGGRCASPGPDGHRCASILSHPGPYHQEGDGHWPLYAQERTALAIVDRLRLTGDGRVRTYAAILEQLNREAEAAEAAEAAAKPAPTRSAWVVTPSSPGMPWSEDDPRRSGYNSVPAPIEDADAAAVEAFRVVVPADSIREAFRLACVGGPTAARPAYIVDEGTGAYTVLA